MKTLTLAIVMLAMGVAQPARADWLLTPFAAASNRTDTTFLDLDDVARRTHLTYGAGLTLRPDGVLGADVEASSTPAMFTGHDLVASSRVTAAVATLVVALPKRWSRIVRPYATVGGGAVHMHSLDIAGIFPTDDTIAVGSASAGAWIPLGSRIGVRASVGYLRTRSDGTRTRFETWQTALGMTMKF
jgi:hypothetical protein